MEKLLNFKTRNIAITDLETTGLDFNKHEIIEIGLVLVKQPEFEITDTLDVKVIPEHPGTADEKASQLNGYSDQEWKNAVSLKEALKIYLEKAKGAIFCAHNIGFDLSFINAACTKTGLPFTLDYHCIDVPSLMWFKYRNSDLERINLSIFAKYLGLEPEPEIHRAINGAMLEYKVLKKMLEK